MGVLGGGGQEKDVMENKGTMEGWGVENKKRKTRVNPRYGFALFRKETTRLIVSLQGLRCEEKNTAEKRAED